MLAEFPLRWDPVWYWKFMRQEERRRGTDAFYRLTKSAVIYWMDFSYPGGADAAHEDKRAQDCRGRHRLSGIRKPYIGSADGGCGYPVWRIDWELPSYERQSLLHQIANDDRSLDEIAAGLRFLPSPVMLVWETDGDDALREYLRNLGRDIVSRCPGFQFAEWPENGIMTLSTKTEISYAVRTDASEAEVSGKAAA